MKRSLLLAALLAFAACSAPPPVEKCRDVKCPAGRTCNPKTGVCSPPDGGFGGGGDAGGSGGDGGGSAGGSGGSGGGSAGGGGGAGGSGGGGGMGGGGGSAGGSGGGGGAGGTGGSAGGTGGSGGFGGGEPTDAGPKGDQCVNAEPLALPSSRVDTTAGFTNNYTSGTGCSSSVNGADRVYVVQLPVGEQLTAQVSGVPDGGSFNPSVQLLLGPASQCPSPDRVCVAAADVGGPLAVDTVKYVNPTAAPLSVFVVVDAFSSGTAGPFSLSVSSATPALGDTCIAPILLTPGTALPTESFAGMSNDYAGDGTACGTPHYGPDRAYAVDVPAGQRLSVTVTPGAGLDTSISIVRDAAACQSRLCLTGSPAVTSAGQVDRAFFTNTGAATTRVLVLVDSGNTTAATFGILATLDVPPVGDVCALAEVLPTDGGVLTGTTVGYGNDYQGAGSSCAGFSTGADRAYTFDVPPGLQANVSVTPGAGYDVSLSVLSGAAAVCDAVPRACLKSTNASGTAIVETTHVGNHTGAPVTVQLVVDGTASMPGAGTFTASASLVAPLVGEVCQNTLPVVTSSTVLTNQTTEGYFDDFNGGAGCTDNPGPDHAYRVSVPGGQRLTATVRPDAGVEVSLDFVLGPAANCDKKDRVCVAAADEGFAGDIDTVGWNNPSPTAQEVFVVVDSYYADAEHGLYDLSLAIGAPPLGDTCLNAVVIAAPGTLNGQTSAGTIDDYEPPRAACTQYDMVGVDRVYSISVPAGKTLTATVTPPSGDDVGIYLLAGPASACPTATACLAGDDSSGSGFSESVTWTNATASPQTVFIVVDSIYIDPYTFSLTTQLQ